ncbi:MAG: DEAD/DEAH box helicase [Pseudohongiellaceae bacterium]
MALSAFHPACRNWFNSRFGAPTPAQARAWPAIQAGRHTLISAPTGSGKTLAAFYAAIDQLVHKGQQGWLEDGVQILYVSPLKALSNDIHRNLEVPLDGIAEHLHLAGQPPVDIRVAVRTGDTPASERQKMARRPPHILVTTPESLYLLLSSASGRNMLATVSTLIVDEIHALLGDKRGAHLALSIERLEQLIRRHSGQHLQRIGLSATQKPIDLVARYLVGRRHCQDGEVDCEIVDAGFQRRLDIRVEVPASPLSALMSNEVWEELYERLVALVQEHETTLVFVNTRRLSERLALALAERLGAEAVCAHHGSMSKDHRHAAEQKLKAGKLRVLVATASMELGIDIGSVDLVVQFSSPKRIATFLQRVGRSGHSVNGTPKGILFPLTRDDLVEAAALIHSIRSGELDRIIMPEKPADILAQQIVAEVSSPLSGADAESDGESDGKSDGESDGWNLDSLYELFTNAWSYRDLSRTEFDAIVSMLAEGYSTRRGRRGTLLHLDAINNRIRARRGANLTALTNGGAIPDMFDYQVVLDPEDTVVGTLNEDFALEALPGDVFTLGTHAWQLLRIDGLKVRVRDADGMQPTIPFWFGEGPGRTQELSQSVSRLRATIAELLIEDSANAATQWLCDEAGLPRSAATQLVEYLQAGMRALGVMPTRETLVMERFFDEVGDMHVVIHSPFGSRLNRAWGLALRKRFCRTFNFELQAAANEDSIVISLGSVHSFALDEVFRYLNSATVREVLIQAMLDAPMFEVRWRWNATRSLAIQRNRNGKRVPPQFQRMDAEDLVAQVFPDQIACQENITGKREIPDHPLVNQTVADCLTEAMDIAELESLIGDIENDRLTLVAMDLREPSPFAQEIINARPYAFLDDAPFEERRTNAIRHRSWADPAETRDYSELDFEAIERVKSEAWPQFRDAEELHDALFSLVCMTDAEYARHECARFSAPLIASKRILQTELGGQSLWIASERSGCFKALNPALVIPDALPANLLAREWTPAEAARELVRGRLEGLGPVTAVQLAQDSGLDTDTVNAALVALEVEGFAFQGRFTPAARQAATPDTVEWCERRLLQRIHRYTIDSHRKAIQPVSLEVFTEFLFQRHQLLPAAAAAANNGERGERGEQGKYGGNEANGPALDGQTRLQNTLNLLDGVAAPAGSWEADLYPARIPGYDPNWLDVLCISGRVVWGRYGLPQPSPRNLARRRHAGPVRNTPITIAARQNLDLWRALAGAQYSEAERPDCGAVASRIEADLHEHGASFFDQIQSRSGLLRAQIEEGLAELVSSGRVSSDSFTGLRALLTPNNRKPGSGRRRTRRVMFGVADAGRWSLLDAQPPMAAPEGKARAWDVLDEEQLERLVAVYLQRWGVLFRALVEREAFAPPWRVLLAFLRRLELRGKLRGGRFVAGVGGEQFAYPETVDELRRCKRDRREQDDGAPYYCLSACDPLNLFNLVLPNQRLPRLMKNRVLYRGGVPVAVLSAGEVHYLRQVSEEEKWHLQQLLRKRQYPPRLRSYLGAG